MSLIDELKKKRQSLLDERPLQADYITAAQRTLAEMDQTIADLDKAISALTPEDKGEGLLPSPPDESSPQASGEEAAVQIPEGFTKWEGGDWVGSWNGKVDVVSYSGQIHLASPIVDWDWQHGQVKAYRIISEPAEAPKTTTEYLVEALNAFNDAIDEPTNPVSELDTQPQPPVSSEQSDIYHPDAPAWNAGFQEDRKPRPGLIEGAVSKLFGVKEDA